MSDPAPLSGLPAAPGIAIGQALCMAPRGAEVPRYLLTPEQVDPELARWAAARDAAVRQAQALYADVGDASSELAAVLEVHLLLLQDEVANAAVRGHIARHRHNAEWALLAQADVAMERLASADDAYLRARKADLEQVSEQLLHALTATREPDGAAAVSRAGLEPALEAVPQLARIVVARDLSPAELLQLKKKGLAGLVTEVGGVTGHTAIIARSLGVPAVVGVSSAARRVRSGDLLVLDGSAGQVWVNPAPPQLASHRRRRRRWLAERAALAQLKETPARTADGQAVALLANIEQPQDSAAALAAGAAGIGLFRTEFLFMGRAGQLPDEDEQFNAYRQVVRAMKGAPVTIRSVDVGADKPLDGVAGRGQNPALGLRAIRWSLAEPAVFLTQLRAILRAAADGGDVRLLIPMLAHASQIRQTLALLAQAREQLRARGLDVPTIAVGAMIEVPAAALTVSVFLRHFDFLSIGTNDLIQYTLAVDRADASLATLYDPLHPAVLALLAGTIAAASAAGKAVTVCGEMAGDPRFTRLLLGLGLRSFSMEPGQIPRVKREILRTRALEWVDRAQRIVHSDDPAALLGALAGRECGSA